PDWKAWLNVVDELAQESRAKHVPVLVVLFPTFHCFTQFAEYPYADLHQQVRAAFEARGFIVLDLVPAFVANGAPVEEVRVDDEHPNAACNRAAPHVIAARRRTPA